VLTCFLYEWWSGSVAWMWLAASFFDWFDYSGSCPKGLQESYIVHSSW